MAVHEQVVATDDGARLWTTTQGSGRPVVWCHGGPGGTDNLAPVAGMIDDLAQVHRYEQRGCGRSSGGPPYTMARWIADLENLRRHWGHERWVVAGHSFGAALALAYTIEHPQRVEALVYLSCVVRLQGQPDWYEQYQRARLERIPAAQREAFVEWRRRRREGGHFDPALAAQLRRLSVTTDFGDADVARRMARQQEADLAATNQAINRALGADFQRYFLAPNRPADLRRLELPVLLVHGEADPRPLAAVEALAAELRRARLVRLRGVGHIPWWEAPRVLRDTLRAFLAVRSQDLPSGPPSGS
ncbi:MAG TPA: alpha/beta hydrolase [Chloroflexota bacterium]|nr:alpha/beta hydrolase [Chloroflexota bacterium]